MCLRYTYRIFHIIRNPNPFMLLLNKILGDGDYKPYVSSDPDVTTVEMNGSEDFIIIACDGLWDTVTPMSATTCVYKQLLQTEKGTWYQINLLVQKLSILDGHTDSKSLK